MHIYFYSYKVGKFNGLESSIGEGIIKCGEKILDIEGFNYLKAQIKEDLKKEKAYTEETDYLQIISFSYLGKK